MATENNRKYYYLKLRENFFEREEIVILESMPDGFLYSNILMKLYLRSLKDAGRLMFKSLIPYTPDVLATLTRHPVGIVEKAVEIYKQLGLVEVLDNGAMFMLDVENFVGMSSTEADRVRAYRARIEQERKAALAAPQDGVHLYDKRTDEGEELPGNNSLVRMDGLVQSYEHEQTGETAETLEPQGKAELSTNEAYKCTPEIEYRDKRIENRDIDIVPDEPEQVPTKKSRQPSPPYQDIIDYLNDKANKNFKATSKETRRLILARWKDGYALEDFQRVIDGRVAKWYTDARMQEYLRPMTLFSSKFESYLNDAGPVNAGPGTYQQQPQQGPTNIPDWAEEDRRKQAQIKTNKERMTPEQAACYKHNQELYSQLMYQKLTFFEKDKPDLTIEQEEYLESWGAFAVSLENADFWPAASANDFLLKKFSF